MRFKIFLIIIVIFSIENSVFASAYRIPEQSIDSTSKAGANIANANGPDAAYYNPANMAWIKNGWLLETNLTYAYLSSVDYEDFRSSSFDGSSEEEHFFLPTFFAVSPDYNDFRFGLSVTSPFGLSKRWRDPFPKKFSEKFELSTIEINPSISYKINNYLSIGGGVRCLYSDATAVMNASPDAFIDFEGDSIDFGWNAAVSIKPDKNWNISVTYRSHIDMNLDGNAELMALNGAFMAVSQAETDSFPAPAVLSISTAYKFDKLVIELTWDRTYWSEYEGMDLTFSQMNEFWSGVFGLPKQSSWNDSSSYRVGLEYQISNVWTLMAGFGYDETPIPTQSVDFSLPGSDTYPISLGSRFKMNENIELGIGSVYGYKPSRKVQNETLDGEFTNSSALLITAGLTYTF